jgi:glutathione S-transferase
MRGNPAPYRLVAAWNDAVVQAGIARLVVSDIPPLLGEADRAYFVTSREKRFGMPLAQVTADRATRLPAFREALHPLRMVVRGQAFLGGDTPDYADMIVFGSFMWALRAARAGRCGAWLARADAGPAWRHGAPGPAFRRVMSQGGRWPVGSC